MAVTDTDPVGMKDALKNDIRMADLKADIADTTSDEVEDAFNLFGEVENLPDVVMPDELLHPSYQSKMVAPEPPPNEEASDETATSNTDLEDVEEEIEVEDVMPKEEIKGWFDKKEKKVEALEAKAASDKGGQTTGEAATKTFWEEFLGDINELWGMWGESRESIHSFVYDFWVERPNGVSELRKIRQKIINKGKQASDEEFEALKTLNLYLDDFSKRKSAYLSKLKYHKLQEKWGKKWLNLKLREMKVTEDIPEWVVPLVVFGLAEFNAAARLRDEAKGHQPPAVIAEYVKRIKNA